MDIMIDMAQVRPFRLERAILLYGGSEGGRSYASVHDVEVKRVGAKPTLGAGAPVNEAFVRGILSSLGQELESEYFPSSLLYRTHDLLAWWTPAQHRTLFFRDGSDLAEFSADDFPVPPLVWCIRGSIIWVRALAEDARPEPSTPLWVAPFWNTNPGTGRICQGTMAHPSEASPATMERWSDSYFKAQFTHQDGAGRLTAHPGGHDGLWRALVGSRKPFPRKHLVRAPAETLHRFVTGQVDHG